MQKPTTVQTINFLERKLDVLNKKNLELNSEFNKLIDQRSLLDQCVVAYTRQENKEKLETFEKTSIEDAKKAFPNVNNSQEAKQTLNKLDRSMVSNDNDVSLLKDRKEQTKDQLVFFRSKVESPGEYIDNLPQHHNPFDDLGGGD
jgi:TATA-binding protein-associated factor Taf7